MVFLALEPAAAREVIDLSRKAAFSVWVGADALTVDEFQGLLGEGIKITRFSYPLSGASPETGADAVSTIEEHHPNETLWLQRITRS